MNFIDPTGDNLTPLLYSFDPISLSEMDGVKLLDRTDRKYLFNHKQLPAILNDLQPNYKILEINGVRRNNYESLYFDTDGFKLYLDHHNGRINRYKVRYRKYADSNLVYFEVKFKNNKGRTIKSRVKRKDIHESIEGKAAELLYDKTPLEPDNLKSKFWVNYCRITLVNKFTTERLTLDLGLNFKSETESLTYNNIVIAEVKQEKISASPFVNTMKLNHIREGSLSKYCFGVISLVNNIKKNRFKKHLSTVTKISKENETEITV